jgi:hypothetical protein
VPGIGILTTLASSVVGMARSPSGKKRTGVRSRENSVLRDDNARRQEQSHSAATEPVRASQRASQRARGCCEPSAVESSFRNASAMTLVENPDARRRHPPKRLAFCCAAPSAARATSAATSELFDYRSRNSKSSCAPSADTRNTRLIMSRPGASSDARVSMTLQSMSSCCARRIDPSSTTTMPP